MCQLNVYYLSELHQLVVFPKAFITTNISE